MLGNDMYYKNYKIYGWFRTSQMTWYKSFAEQVKNGKIVEVGVFGGASLLSITETCIVNNTKLYGVDPWDKLTKAFPKQSLSETRKDMNFLRLNLMKIITELNYQNTVTLKRDFSVDAAKKFDDEDLDLIFIDGNHEYKNVYNDLQSWIPKLKPNCWMIGHDYRKRPVGKAVREFCRQNKLKVTSKIDNTCWEFKKI